MVNEFHICLLSTFQIRAAKITAAEASVPLSPTFVTASNVSRSTYRLFCPLEHTDFQFMDAILMQNFRAME
jgi:hypothetical protein